MAHLMGINLIYCPQFSEVLTMSLNHIIIMIEDGMMPEGSIDHDGEFVLIGDEE